MGLDEGAGAVLAVLVTINFLFLLCLGRMRLSERQQTGVWLAFAVLFFASGFLLTRRAPHDQRYNGGQVAVTDVGKHRI